MILEMPICCLLLHLNCSTEVSMLFDIILFQIEGPMDQMVP